MVPRGDVAFEKPTHLFGFWKAPTTFSNERQSLIITTNLPFEEWIEILGNERLTGALLDRFTHRIHIVEANGESYRLRAAKRRAKRNISE